MSTWVEVYISSGRHAGESGPLVEAREISTPRRFGSKHYDGSVLDTHGLLTKTEVRLPFALSFLGSIGSGYLLSKRSIM
jgi:hypothetical protein